MNLINLFNSTVPGSLNTSDVNYEAIFGKEVYTPEVTILESEDINCGAIMNELEFCKLNCIDIAKSLHIDNAEGDALDTFINAFLKLPRKGIFETDDIFRNRFKLLVTQKTNYRRCTKWAIMDALSYFIDKNSIKIIEPFDYSNLYFQIRFIGSENIISFLYLDSGHVDNDYISGLGVGTAFIYLIELLDRIKPLGVDYDIYIIDTDSITITSDATIA